MNKHTNSTNFHNHSSVSTVEAVEVNQDMLFRYTFENFFHPFVGELIAKLNRDSLPGMLDTKAQELRQDFFKNLYNPTQSIRSLVQVNYSPKEIDVSMCGPYANYNWEMFFHIPIMIAVHLSKNQRFAEAQRWFHYIFNPTSNDQRADSLKSFWKFLTFRNLGNAMTIDEIVRVLSTPGTELSDRDQCKKDSILNGYDAILNKPFQPHAVARTRHLAYQYTVVMKYLDNLIAWGDHLFQKDTVESINEAIQLYVLAANILGERPQKIPQHGTVKPMSFAQLKEKGLGPIGNTFVELQGQLPLIFASPNSGAGGSITGDSSPLFGIGRTLYFCIPRNDKLLGYWDTVADRLFKIRHCMNIAGVVRPLALFDPPIDPGMLVKATAAGIDIGSIVSGLNQPVGPVRCLILIQKALELCGEVRALGNALLSALEKKDAEKLALVRQCHEIKIQQMLQDVRFLQWKSAEESTTSLLKNRETALKRLHYYQRLLGLPADSNAPDTIPLDRCELTEENFNEAYSALVDKYDKRLTLQELPALKLAGGTSPAQQSGATGQGQLYLNINEDLELNKHLPNMKKMKYDSSVSLALINTLALSTDLVMNTQFWGLGISSNTKLGSRQIEQLKFGADIVRIQSELHQDEAGMASRTAGYERRADDWIYQYNLAAHELMQNGRQILTSLIAEQVTHHEYKNIQQQIKNANEIDQLLHEKFTNEGLYLWMQGEISRLYYEYYRFAFDTARRAERTMKQELMRPELDAQDFIKFNYWDGGRKGLLSGEALYLDVKRMEMAYHDYNKRELELTKQVSLRQLNPLALLTLKATGTCQVMIPEWLYDLDCPGHYMRRIKSVAISIPSVVGPYTSVNCTLSLLRSSLRKSPVGDYMRGSEDDRFVDYIGAVQSIVTSGGTNDSGLFETNLRDERFLPFEGAGAESTWKLDLPKDYRAFDYSTISDVIFHIRYTARQGVVVEKVNTALCKLFQSASQSNLALLFSLKHDFPTEWAKFVNGKGNFTATIKKDHFPYFIQNSIQKKKIKVTEIDLYNGEDVTKHRKAGDAERATKELSEKAQFTLDVGSDTAGPTQVLTRIARAEVFLIVRYSL